MPLYVRGAGVSSYELTAGMQYGQSPVVRLLGSTWVPLGAGAFGDVESLALFAFRYVAAFSSGFPLVRALDPQSRRRNFLTNLMARTACQKELRHSRDRTR